MIQQSNQIQTTNLAQSDAKSNNSLYPNMEVNTQSSQEIKLGWHTTGADEVKDNVFIKNNHDGWNSKFRSTALPLGDIDIVLQISSICKDKSGMAFGIARNNQVLDKNSLTSLQEEVCINGKGFHYQYKTNMLNK